jgi:hypothetical protein
MDVRVGLDTLEVRKMCALAGNRTMFSDFTLHSPCILSYIIAFIITNTCTTILSSYIPLHMFRLLISHHQGDQSI